MLTIPRYRKRWRASKRSASESRLVEELTCLIQEILSGVTTQRDFDVLPIISDDYERVADFYNTCRRNGIQGSRIDFLIRSELPDPANRYSAVWPLLFLAEASAPCSRNEGISFIKVPTAANSSGVFPFFSATLTSAPLSSSRFTIP